MGTKFGKEKAKDEIEQTNSDLKGVGIDISTTFLSGDTEVLGMGEFKDEFHICNECRNPIRSCPEVIRYRCIECKDYDLCEPCFLADNIKIPCYISDELSRSKHWLIESHLPDFVLKKRIREKKKNTRNIVADL